VFEIGTTLREARVRRNLTLQQVEEDTKIRVKYIQAMENEEFDVMPGPTYIMGFLRSYSSYLGLDPEVIIAEYRSRAASGDALRPPEPFGGVSALGAPRSHRGRNTIVFVAVLCLLVLAVIYVLGLNSGGDDGGPGTSPSALGISPSPSPSPSAPPSPSPSPTPTVRPGLEDVVRVEAARGDCWLQVRRNGPQGVTLYSGTLTRGQAEAFKGKVLWLRLGNPPAVRIIVQGKTQKAFTGAEPVDLTVQNGKMKEGS
jgi:transcriptional regulator with XRE-family HTH domain